MTVGEKPPAISVVLPTFNRADALVKVLGALESQSFPLRSFEVVVVDDGSSDGTAETLADYAGRTALSLRFNSLGKNSGPAAARNAALRMARGKIIVIIGDDIVPPPEFVGRHAVWHEAHPDERDALLGYVTWPAEIRPSRFMKWLEEGGRSFYFAYGGMKSGAQVSASCFYTCNLSVKRGLLFRTELFDETFPHASHEDLELGHRLGKLGMRLWFERSVKGFHWHYLTIESAARRIYLMGYSASIYWQKVEDGAGAAKRMLRSVIPSLFASFPMVTLWKTLCRSNLSDEKGNTLAYRTLLTLCYWIGLGDSRKGIPPRDVGGLFSGEE
jgi:glycosyltransferase involved in cell wall biosynthesis